MIELRVLGTTILEKEDGSLEYSVLSGPKRLAILTYLVLHDPQGFVRRDELIAMFWPESGQKKARNALSNILYHIRESLGKDIIINRGTEEIGVNQDKIWCDAIAFEKALEDSEPRKALSLYKDDLLIGFHVSDVSNEFENWLDRERQRLRSLACEGAWKIVEESEEKGNYDAAQRWARKATAFEPYSEKAHKRLIDLLKRTGNTSDALRIYEAFSIRLQNEWDMEPSPELQKIIEDISIQAQGHSKRTLPTETQEDIPARGSDLQHDREWAAKNSLKKENVLTTETVGSSWLLIIAGIGILAVAFIMWFWWNDSSVKSGSNAHFSGHSVAVLPFTYLGVEDSTDYFSLGMTEEILARLAQVSDLAVISRTSVMRYRDTEKSLKTIGKELGATAVVEGSVQRVGNRVRITAQLIDAQTDRHLWGASYDRALEDILGVQSDVATKIAGALEAKLLPGERDQLATRRNVDEKAYHLYLQGQYLLNQLEPKGLEQAPDLFLAAIQHDSTFAPAYGGLAMALVQLGVLNWGDFDVTGIVGLSPETAARAALEASDNALAHDSTVVAAHLAKAMVHELFLRNWKQSSISFQRALGISPNNSEVRREYGWYLLRIGQLDSALVHMEYSVALDPFSWAAHHGLGYTYYCERRYGEAIQHLETALNLGSGYPNTKKYLSTARFKEASLLFDQGRIKEAEALMDKASAMLNEMWDSSSEWREPLMYAVQREKARTLEELQRVELPFAPKLYTLLLVGQIDPALTMINEGLNFNSRVYSDPIFDMVRDEPKFVKLVEQKLGREINDKGLYKHLKHGRHKRRRGNRQDSRGRIKGRVSITKRPEVVEERSRLGDIEVDLMMGKAHKSALLVLTDRATLLTALQKVTSRKAEEIANQITGRLGQIPSSFVKTLTFDNDKAFARHQDIAENLEADTYFTRPYTSQDKGTVENRIWVLRRFFPKGTDLRKISQERISIINLNGFYS
ncbi:IS30 family transposase [Fodinibius sp.]|uniref:IS30 family transposase n=1 Tax=Fodinibius sp. TaxID=1872440 RepID=UPI002ACE95A9|nr:IS30 family transposase [Fodinibius sp.]MDZ7658179.1 IS30 family transposase [Fodinibius sp.]